MRIKLEWWVLNGMIVGGYCAAIFGGIEGAGRLAFALVALSIVLIAITYGCAVVVLAQASEATKLEILRGVAGKRALLPPEWFRNLVTAGLFALLAWHGWAWSAAMVAADWTLTQFVYGGLRLMLAKIEGGEA